MLIPSFVSLVAGIDEAGRGPLAGPVVAAAVILDPQRPIRGLRDSKLLNEQQRDDLAAEIRVKAIAWAVGQADVLEIDRINILQATHRAMALALEQLSPPPEHVLVDGLAVGALRWPQTALIQGDARSYSISAASVIAKVTRDRLMIQWDREWPAYGFAEHKGYGTPQHLAALAEHGPCPIHRRSFAPLRPMERDLFGELISE